MTVYGGLFLQTVSLALTSKHLESGLKTEKVTFNEELSSQTEPPALYSKHLEPGLVIVNASL